MADIQWQQTSFNPVKFNPSAGFASAGKIFSDITGTLEDRKKQEDLLAKEAEQMEIDRAADQSLAAYRASTIGLNERGQLFAEGEPGRQTARDLQLHKFDMEKLRAEAALKAKAAAAAGGAGTVKPFPVGTPKSRSEITKNFVESRGLDKTPDTIFGMRVNFPGTNMDPAGSDIDNAVGRLASMGITSDTSIKAALDESFATDGNTIKDSYNWNTNAGFKKLYEFARITQDKERQLINTRTGQVSTPTPQQSLFEQGKSENLSDEELIEDALLGDVQAPPAQVQPAPEAVPAPVQGGIMPAAQIDMSTADIPETSGQKIMDSASSAASSIFGGINEARKEFAKDLGGWVADKRTASIAKSDANLKKVISSISKNKSSEGLTRQELYGALNTDLSDKDRDIIARLLANHTGK